MKKLLARLIWLPMGFVLVVFLVANRTPVPISLDPISTERPALATPPLPLWVWLLSALFVGFFLGAAGMWVSARDSRIAARANARELKALRAQLAAKTAETPAQPESSPAEALPTIEMR